MRRMLLLAIIILVTIIFLPSPTVQTQQPEKDQYPNLENYPPAGANCKNKWKLEPWLGTPAAGPGKSRCVLSVYNCKTRKTDTYTSLPRDSGTVTLNCDDYEDWKKRLATIKICCDCAPPSPWFDTSAGSGCKEVQSPQVTVNEATVTLSLCGYAIWSVKSVWGATGKPDIEGANDEMAPALKERVRSQVGSRICCDRFREAARTGVPCDPRADLDCDGKPNREDTAYPQRYVSPRDNETYSYSGSLPDINIFSTLAGAPIDPFPQGLNPDDPNFIPPADKCECKWELVKGTLTCSPDGKQPHVYQARWRCPSSGNERFGRKEAPATAPCTPPKRARL